MYTSPIPTCPQCKQSNQVQKVSSVYGLNTKEWYETSTRIEGEFDTSSQVKHEAHTTLGLKLEPPEKPANPIHPGIWYGVGIGLVLLVLSGMCPVLITPLLIVGGVLAEGEQDIPQISGQPAWVFIVAAGLLVLFVGLVVLIIAGVFIKRRYDRSLAGYKQKKKDHDEYELPRWENAMERWNQLYFCLRDETLFIPGEEKSIRLEDMHEYLMDPYFKST